MDNAVRSSTDVAGEYHSNMPNCITPSGNSNHISAGQRAGNERIVSKQIFY